MGSWLLLGVFVGVFLTLQVAGLIINRRIGRSLSPRVVRKRYRWVILNQLTTVGMVACLLVFHRPIEWQMALLFGVIVLSTAPLVWLMLRRQTEDEAQRNFAHDTRHCGRCEYDLTGNVSGICLECGWAIPKTPMRLQSPDWARWWRKWEIEYLENWPRTLRMVKLSVVMFGAIAVGLLVFWIYWPESWLFVLLVSLPMWLMAGHMLILSIRVATYGRKQGPTT
jgi:hypothetical protein